MTLIAFLQVFASFIIGGGFIATLSLVAEKTNERIAGIILMFPTTIVLGFFFLGVTTSAGKVAEVIPATLIPLGIVVFSSLIYIHVAKFYERYKLSASKQVIATFITAAAIWFVLAAPFAIYRFHNLGTGICGYFILTSATHYFLNRDKAIAIMPRPAYTRKQVLFRAVFIGGIIALVVLLGKTTGPFWGGIFTMFPAATFAGLMILHFYYEPKQLFFFMQRAPLGSLTLFVYAITAMLAFPKWGVGGGTGIAYGISMLFSFALIWVQHRIGRKKLNTLS